MKKRTVCFGWTKKFQRRVKHANDLTALAIHVRDANTSKKLREAAASIVAAVKGDHRARVKQLRGVA
jgi:hypothetical protein